MKYCKLGLSDLDVSVVGLGTMSWPGCHYGQKSDSTFPLDRELLRSQVLTALDAGINLIDTAPGYGQGLAEELLGYFLDTSGRRKEVIVVTKVGPLFGEEVRDGRDIDLSASGVRKSCESSLRRLRTDCIDLYLAHRPDPFTPVEETCGVMAELRKEGKIRWFGVSNFSNDLLERAMAQEIVAANQIPYSLVDRTIEKDRLPFCLKNKVGIMAYSPLGKGILTGKYNEERLPPVGDYRHDRPHFSKENLARNLELTARVSALAEKGGMTPGQLVLAWAIAQPGICTVLPGAKTLAQVQENADAGSISLDESMVKELSLLSS